MIRHLLKLVWNRKRTNGLVILEIFLSFLVVFSVVALGASSWFDLQRPVGFDWRGVWYVTLNAGNERGWFREQIPVLQRVLRELQGMEEIEAVTAGNALPFDGNRNINGNEVDGVTIRAETVLVTEGFDAVFGTPVVAGRWFDASDLALAWNPVVVDRDMARTLYGDADPLGRTIPVGRFPGESRIVGVVDEFRKAGELGGEEVPSFVFELYRPEDPEAFLTNFALRLRPALGPEFERELVRRVGALAPLWSVEVKTLEQIRASELRQRLAPLAVAAIVAAFLLLMVALGLIGVLWQNVTRRTRELGLRRAVGADRGQVYRQILLELMLITTIGVGLGVLTVVQLPLLDPWGLLAPRVLVCALFGAVFVIYLLSAVSGLYPSWLATRVQPAEALHYE